MKQAILFVLLAFGCNGVTPTPPCELTQEDCQDGPFLPDVCECSTCSEGTLWNGQACEVVDPPLPPPPPGPPTTDYLTLGRAQSELEYQNSKWEGLAFELQANIWRGARDPATVANKCPWSTQPFFGKSTKQMWDFSDVGYELNEEGERLLKRLPLINRRCSESHPEHDPAFCGRSEVRKEVWGDFKSALLEHRDESSRMADAVQMALCPALAWQASWDSIAGWCQAMNKFELRSCQ